MTGIGTVIDCWRQIRNNIFKEHSHRDTQQVINDTYAHFKKYEKSTKKERKKKKKRLTTKAQLGE